MQLLDVRNLSVYFFTDEGIIRAVDGVSLTLEKGKTLGIVGESGCGKSVTALSILKLVPPPGKVLSGEVLFDGVDLRSLPEAAMVQIRGKKISMIFQDPMTSLNPVLTVGYQIAEAVTIHEPVGKKEARNRALEMLRLVRIPNPEARYDAYPHQLSGGMRQRVMIAMALACNPLLLIADEPTTALDVTVQAQILELMQELQERFKMSIILITHNLGIVAEMCQEVVVMYAGRVVERAPVDDIFRSPRHPYTVGLLESLPRLDEEGGRRLVPIEGQLPILREEIRACAFAPRCRMAERICTEKEPDLYAVSPDHESRCYFHDRVRVRA